MRQIVNLAMGFAAGLMTQKEQEKDLQSLLDKKYKAPGQLRRRPTFDLDTIETVITLLEGADNFDREYYRKQILGYKLLHMVAKILWIRYVIAIAMAAGIFSLTKDAQEKMLTSQSGQDNIYRIMLLGVFVFLIFATAFPIKFDISFYRCTTRAEKEAYKSGGAAMIRCFNLGGTAARHLYKSLQESKRSWTAPPAVSDRALALSYPLIDVTIDYHANPDRVKSACRSYSKFVHFSSALMAVDRVDLIPNLRETFDQPELPRRNLDERGSIPDRYAHFLDPMREYNRWSLIRDYLYPLGTWLSFAVSLTALLVSFTR